MIKQHCSILRIFTAIILLKVFTVVCKTSKLSIIDVSGYAKTCLRPNVNNKGADQPAHPRSLISTFVARCLDSLICILAISKVSKF